MMTFNFHPFLINSEVYVQKEKWFLNECKINSGERGFGEIINTPVYKNMSKTQPESLDGHTE